MREKRIVKRKILKKTLALLIIASVLLTASACRKEPTFSMDNFNKHENTVTTTFSFTSDDSSEAIVYDKTKLEEFKNTLASYSVEYGYDELFNYEQAISGIRVDCTVSEHKFSALDSSGKLTKEHLFEIVRKNNAAYLDGMPSIVEDIDDELLLRICEIIVDTINDTLSDYPDIDKARVYCNLGNLKVVEKKSALDFAAVEPGMVLHINSNTSTLASMLTESNMYSVLAHESMHIIQYGCSCESVEGCTRRCGLAFAYKDREQDYSDWIWLAEGSAELMASLYANVEPMTYENMVNYILSLDLATMLDSSVPANYVETLSFYNDLDKLFSLFDATTDEQKQEIYKMLYSLEIMQMEPDDVKKAYQRIYGQEWTDEIRDELNNRVKRPIVQTLTKVFFANLADAICDNNLSKNDFFFLMNLYESTINYHLRLDKSGYDHYNEDFVAWYGSVRKDLFACIENVSVEDYEQYTASDGSAKIFAGMKWLDQEKRDFLIAKFESNKCDYKYLSTTEE